MRGDENPFVAAFSAGEWAAFTGHAEHVALQAGLVLMRRGQPPSHVYIVDAGCLEAVDPRSSPPTVLGVFAAGAVLGEMSFLDGEPVSADVRVGEGTTVFQFANDHLTEVLGQHPELDRAFHRGTTRTLLERTRRLTATTVTEAMGRRLGTDEVRRFSVGSTSGGHAMKVQALMALGLDPHAAVAAADGVFPSVTHALTGRRTRIGSSEDCDIVLPDARIAPIAAELVRVDEDWRIVSVGSRAVAVHGRSVSSAPVVVGDTVQIGRYAVTLEETCVRVEPLAPTFLLRAEGIGRTLGGKTLLEGVSFGVLSGEVVALIGPSGAGKTTLLDALRDGADRGQVWLDDRPFHPLLRANPTLLGEVPQDDIVLPELTVEESLLATAALRLPHLSTEQRASAVHRVIDELGLGAIRHSRIGDPDQRGISGGQRKRVNIAQEVLTPTTRILFLDEPTSGLDPRSAADIARLARRLADQGRIVLIVTHDMSEEVLAQVDHLLVLVPGGALAWFGPVDEGVAHFNAAHPSQIFDRLVDRTAGDWAARYRSSDTHLTWVARRSTLIADGQLACAEHGSPSPIASVPSQLWTLTAQYARVKLRDRSSVVVLGAQPLLVAAVMNLVFPKATAGLVFLLVLSCFWFGMSASVRELIADRVVWRRQRRLGISPVAWVGSKALVLGFAVAAQCAVVTGAAYASSGLGELGFSAQGLLGACVLTAWSGLGIGLFVSALWRRSEAAVGTIVLLLVPQIAFSGILMPLDQARTPAVWLSTVTPVRYAFQLALRTGERLDYVMGLGGWAQRPVSGELFSMGLRPPGADALGLPLPVLIGILVATTLLGLVGAMSLMNRRGR